MQTKVEKKKDVNLFSDITIDMQISCCQHDVESEDFENLELVFGKIHHIDVCEMTGKEIVNEIGTFSMFNVTGDEYFVFNALDNHSSETARYLQELFIIKGITENGGFDFEIREEYDDLFINGEYSSFLILHDVSIKEEFRGLGILSKLVATAKRVFNKSIMIQSFPNQYSHRNHETFIGVDRHTLQLEYTRDLKKVTKAFQKCGFKKLRRGSDFLFIVF